MDSITLRLDSETIEELDEEASEHDVSRSEYIRDMIDSREELDHLRTENDRLRARVAALIEQREEHDELVEYVENERELATRRHEADVVTRLKWWVFGGDEDD